MSETEISEMLESSYTTRDVVEIQLSELNTEGNAYADIIGVVEGFRDTSIFVSHPDTGIQVIPSNSINHIRMINPNKWSDLS